MAVPCHKMVARTKPKCDSCTSAPPPSHGLLHPQKETPSEAPARVTSYLPLKKYAVWPLTAINDALGLVLCSAHPTLPPMNFSTLGMFSCSQFRLNFLLSPISFTWSNAQKLEAVFFLAAQPPPINTTAELTYSNFFPLSTSLIHEGFPKAYMQRQQIHFLSICKVTHWLVISGHKKKFLLFGWNLILSPGPSMYLLSFGSWKLTWLRTKNARQAFPEGAIYTVRGISDSHKEIFTWWTLSNQLVLSFLWLPLMLTAEQKNLGALICTIDKVHFYKNVWFSFIEQGMSCNCPQRSFMCGIPNLKDI